ncbi:hypothetical protein NHX12_009843 [Muraenolepis orangiensis]|uniref:EF-hand domain-containing protein n=1 Tax=Muraenolepis orangiensis TaxID=630683 RepID=A0A9Q0DK44_9TELE|nr:hypothetical protein NHX12_009843 [Muraenolepis orangiensis]
MNPSLNRIQHNTNYPKETRPQPANQPRRMGPDRHCQHELPLSSGRDPGSPLLRVAAEAGDELPVFAVVENVASPAESSVMETFVEYSLPGLKMPFHHVRAGLLYPDNYLSSSLSEGNEAFQLNSISTEELAEIREAFRILDRDGNGFISKQELGMAMRSLGYMPSEVELAIIMQRLDMDGDGQVDFEEFMTILGPKLLSADNREGFLGTTIDNIFWQRLGGLGGAVSLRHIDMRQQMPRRGRNRRHGGSRGGPVHPKKKNRQTCVRKSLICAFAMAFIISVMLIAANQMLRNGME